MPETASDFRLPEDFWHKSAPDAVRKTDPTAGWFAWTEYLAEQGRGKAPDISRAASPAWLDRVFSAARRKGGSRSWEGTPRGRSLEREVDAWIDESSVAEVDVPHAEELLVVCQSLPWLAAIAPARAWVAVVEYLVGVAKEAPRIDLDESPLVHQLLAGQLAWILCCQIPEVDACRTLKSSARKALSRGLEDLLDGEGLPHASNLPYFRRLLCCWTVCRTLAHNADTTCWNSAAEAQFGWAVRQTLRLIRYDGTRVFSSPDATPSKADIETIRGALKWDDDPEDDDIAAVVLPTKQKGKGKSGKRHIDEDLLPEPAYHSEWAAVSVLRRRWARSGEQLTTTFSGQTVNTEFSCGKDVLWSGAWDLDIRVDGKPALPMDDAEWEEVCWISDDDADYIELELEFTHGLTVQRQMLLARQDGFLMLGDVLISEGAKRLEYRSHLPLWPGIEFEPADESVEGFLGGTKHRASVFPLALSEWRDEEGVSPIGELAQTSRGLELTQSLDGCRMYAPLFFDLDRRRMRRPFTWRRLTVAESLDIQRADVAVGFRVLAGGEQWLIYRSLAQRANRTLLGHNLSCEMLVAQFDETGEVEPLVETE